MVHDLRGPVSRVKAVAELLQAELDSVLPDSPQADLARGWLTIIDRAAVTMEQQFQVLLDVTRERSDEPSRPHFASIDLVNLIRQQVAEYAVTDSHQFCMQFSHDELIGMWDELLLDRAIDNLVGNAVKYTPTGGKITVSAELREEDGHRLAVVSVADSGIGIPADDLPHVFDVFHRGSNVRSTQRGAGIGLASVHEIVKQHAGEISITSTEGVGTTATICLPFVPPASRVTW